MKNYYEELEVSRNASKEVINRAYKVLAKKYHPDTTTENKQFAEERFKKISEAYEILSDSQKRSNYNSELEKQRKAEKQKNTEAYKKITTGNDFQKSATNKYVFLKKWQHIHWNIVYTVFPFKVLNMNNIFVFYTSTKLIAKDI